MEVTTPNRAERREAKRAMDRTAKNGCDCCGKPLSRIMPALVLRTPAGMKIQHATCPMPPDSVCTMFVSAEFGGTNPDIDGDRIWFEAHPGAVYRFRKALPEEWDRWRLSNTYGALREGMAPPELPDVPEDQQFMAVRQFEPGKRARMPVGVPDGVPWPDEAEMAKQFASAFGKKQGVSLDAALIAVTCAAKDLGILDHDVLDIAAAEGEARDAIKH